MRPRISKIGCVRRSVGPSIGPSARVEKWENAHFRPCPPVRNWWPCIRPCYFDILITYTYYLTCESPPFLFSSHPLASTSTNFNSPTLTTLVFLSFSSFLLFPCPSFPSYLILTHSHPICAHVSLLAPFLPLFPCSPIVSL